MARLARLLAAVNVLLGGWLVAAPFVFDVALNIALWNHVVVGAIVVLLSGYDVVMAGVDEEDTVDTATYVALLCLWVIVSPFLLGFPDPVGFWNNLVVGILVATSASYAAYVTAADATDVRVRTA